MLGEKIDTILLKLISHNRNIHTEEEIIAAADNRLISLKGILPEDNFKKFTNRAGCYFKWKGKKILDVACGFGDLANALAKNGASTVYGIDIQKKHIRAAESIAKENNIYNVTFVETNFHDWNTDERFDYVISNEALDHIPDTRAAVKKMASLLKEDGKIINVEAGFWLGPSADHCDGFMKIFIPWRHLIFNEKALLNVRKEKYRPTDAATRFRDVRGGLSKFTYSGYLNAIRESELKIMKMETNFQLRIKNKKLLQSISNFITKFPVIGEFFIFSTITVLSKEKNVS